MATKNVRPIRSEKDYEQALARIDQLIDAPYGTPEADELQVLGILVEAYENERHAIDPPIGMIAAARL
jgi:HTH-type transcriptional regulator / antitoxin HigA